MTRKHQRAEAANRMHVDEQSSSKLKLTVLLNPFTKKKKSEKCCHDGTSNKSMPYICGACGINFNTVCMLHTHVLAHSNGGSYYYNHSNRTAYPKFDLISQGTQTHMRWLEKHARQTFIQDLTKSENARKNLSLKFDNNDDEKFDSQELHNSQPANSSYNCKDDNEHMQDERNTDNDANGICKNKTEFENVSRDSDTDAYSPFETLTKILSQKKRKSKSKRLTRKHRKKKLKCIETNENDSKPLSTSNLVKDENDAVDMPSPKMAKVETDDICLSKSSPAKEDKIRLKKQEWELPAKTDEKIFCMFCNDDSFTKRILLRQHIKTSHTNVPFLCSLCGLQCDNEEDLKIHRKTDHNRYSHECVLCNKVLSTKGMLEGHYLVHKGIKPFSCEICIPQRQFTRRSQLKAHMETHSTEKSLQCEFCGKPFNARYLMIMHVKHCGGIKPHKCEFCDMSFVSNHYLQRHRRVHTGEKPYVCEVCAFASSNPTCLARHMRTHTGEKPFVCQYCSQTFAAPGALKKHIRIHTQEKPYKCSYCTKAFTQKWNLKTHERQHTGETPYKCNICGVGYKQNVLLKTHVKLHYGNMTDSADMQQSPNGQQQACEQQEAGQALVSLQAGSINCKLKRSFSELASMTPAMPPLNSSQLKNSKISPPHSSLVSAIPGLQILTSFVPSQTCAKYVDGCQHNSGSQTDTQSVIVSQNGTVHHMGKPSITESNLATQSPLSHLHQSTLIQNHLLLTNMVSHGSYIDME